jgi:endonuclease/exonuclease/phosphatase family metal-dependent hydrolase
MAVAGLSSAALFSPRTEAPRGPVTLASWNIENFFDVYDDPYTRDDVTKPAYVNQARQKRIAAVLRELDADIVALQEVENRYLLQQFVDTYLNGMNYQVVLIEGNDTRGIDVALLSRLPIESVSSYQHRRFADSHGVEQNFRRDLLRVRIGGDFGGDVYVVHLKSQFGDRAADIVREAEAREISRIVAQNRGDNSTYRAVVIGDFNEVDDMPTLEILRDSGLVDSMADTEKYSYNKKPYLTRIDFALMTPALADRVADAQIINQLGQHELKKCSDHYPLLVNFK